MGDNSNLITALKATLSYSSERQKVLGQNIANANTPGYKAKDLAPIKFSDYLNNTNNDIKITVTSPMHINKNEANSSFNTIKQQDTYETTPTGNNVVIEDQMLKISENNSIFHLASNLYRKFSSLIKLAVSNK